MSHDPNVVLLGARVSSIADITNENGDPSVFKAGLAVRKGSAGQLLISNASPLIGVSFGSSLISDKLTAVARVGNDIPLLLQDEFAEVKIGDITFTAKDAGPSGEDIVISLVDTLTDGSASVSVTGSVIVIDIEAGTTTALTIKEAIEASAAADALVSAVVDAGDDAAPQAAAAGTALTGGDAFTPVQGAPVLIDPNTGKAASSGDATSATYSSGRKTGVYPDRTTAAVALINLMGGF